MRKTCHQYLIFGTQFRVNNQYEGTERMYSLRSQFLQKALNMVDLFSVEFTNLYLLTYVHMKLCILFHFHSSMSNCPVLKQPFCTLHKLMAISHMSDF